MSPFEQPDRIYIHNSLESFRVCENLNWNYDTATPYRSAKKGIAQRAVRRVKEGTAIVLIQSGLTDTWWSDATKCHSSLRNIQYYLADGRTPNEKRFNGITSKRVSLQTSTSKASSLKKYKSPQIRKMLLPCADGSIKQEGHVAPRPLRLQELRKEEDEAGGDSDTDNALPRRHPTVERETTEENDVCCRISGDYVYRHHIAARGQLYVP